MKESEQGLIEEEAACYLIVAKEADRVELSKYLRKLNYGAVCNTQEALYWESLLWSLKLCNVQ